MRRRAMVGAVAGVVVFGSSAAGALAGGQTVVQAIEAQDKIVKSTPAFHSIENLNIQTPAQGKKLIPKLEAFHTALDHAADVVSEASATAAQKAGQADWVAGSRDVATGIGEVATGLQDYFKGEKSAATSELAKSKKAVAAGDALGVKGKKLLKIPLTD